MPTITASAVEKQIAAYAFEHGVELRRRQIQRMAIQRVRRIERMTDAERERLIMHRDPVPCEALHHLISSECRTCGAGMRDIKEKEPYESTTY